MDRGVEPKEPGKKKVFNETMIKGKERLPVLSKFIAQKTTPFHAGRGVTTPLEKEKSTEEPLLPRVLPRRKREEERHFSFLLQECI